MSIPSSNNFATSYMELCKQQRVRPLPVICVTLPHSLDFTTDRVKMDDWGPILNSLSLDRSLKSVSVRSRYQCRKPLEEINSEDKARSMGKAPVVLSRYLLEWLTHSVGQCLRNSPILTSLELEGVPLPGDCLAALCVGLAGTTSLRHLSLRRCYIGDDSCELLCRTVADLRSIKSLNLSQCELSKNCGPSLAAALSRQKLSLYHETWKDSLRYREPNLEAMPGLRRLTLNGNPRLGDEAIGDLIEAIRDSLWLKALDLQHCGLTNLVGRDIVDLLEHNTTLAIVDVRINSNLSDEIVEEIFRRLEANCAASGNPKSEYRWFSLAQNNRRNVVSAGARRATNRLEENASRAGRPKSALVATSRPLLTGCLRRTTRLNKSIIAKRTITKLETVPNNGHCTIKESKLKLSTGNETGYPEGPRLALHLDIQAQIDSATIEPHQSTDNNRINSDKSLFLGEDFSTERLKSVLEQLSQLRIERDRIEDERRRTDQLLAEEKILRQVAESKLLSMRDDLSDFEAALNDKEKETRGFLLVSRRSLDDIAASFERLLEMLGTVTTSGDSSIDAYSTATATAEIRRRFAHLIRKTKSESHHRGVRVECEETSIIEASTANSAAKKFAKSEGDVRNSLPPLIEAIRLERNIGDSPDIISSRTRRARESYIEDCCNKISAGSSSERARAIFAQIVNGNATINIGAHGS